MGILWRLLLAHFIADFALQTNRVAAWKRHSQWGMAVHVISHPLASILVLWPYLFMTWLKTPWISLQGWVCIVLITLTHLVEDEWRVWAIQKAGSPDNTAFFFFDQAVHITVLLLVGYWSAPLSTPRWVYLALCAVLLAHFTSVLIYFFENDLWNKSDVLSHHKYRLMAERFAGVFLLIQPGYWGLCGVILLVVGYGYGLARKSQDRTWVNYLVSAFSVAFFGLLSRHILHR